MGEPTADLRRARTRAAPSLRTLAVLRRATTHPSSRSGQEWRRLTRRTRGWLAHGGLWDALVEHELCVLAPVAFYGSTFSTWANLIAARRRSARRPSFTLAGGAWLPSCLPESEGAVHGTRGSTAY